MPHIYDNPDLLQPIGEHNREETIVIPFIRGLKNLNFAVTKGLLGDAVHDLGIREKFPRLRRLLNMTSFQMYDETCLFLHPADCVYALSEKKLSWKECISVTEKYLEKVDYWSLHMTRLEYICFQLLKQPFVKHLYILTDKMSNQIGAYCAEQFQQYIETKQVSVIAGNLTQFLIAHPEVTTIFTKSTAEIFALEEDIPEVMNQKYFVSIMCYDDMEEGANGVTVYKRHDRLLKYMEDKKCSVVHMYPYAIIPEERNG